MFGALSRRSFLKRMGLAGATVLLPGCGRSLRTGAASDGASVHWALLSDTHVDATGAAGERTAVIRKRLQLVVEDVLASRPRPTDMLIDGDLAFREGRPEDYELLLELLRPIRSAGINVHLVLGNHDNRENMLRAIDADPTASVLPGRHVAVVDSGPVRLLLLDTLIRPNFTPGELGAEQREWLCRELDRSADRPCVLFMHHYTYGDKVTLQDEQEFMKIIVARPQVKAVIQGHSHHYRYHNVAGIHFMELPAVGYSFSDDQPLGWVHTRFGPRECDMELRAVSGNQTRYGEWRRLPWRSAVCEINSAA